MKFSEKPQILVWFQNPYDVHLPASHWEQINPKMSESLFSRFPEKYINKTLHSAFCSKPLWLPWCPLGPDTIPKVATIQTSHNTQDTRMTKQHVSVPEGVVKYFVNRIRIRPSVLWRRNTRWPCVDTFRHADSQTSSTSKPKTDLFLTQKSNIGFLTGFSLESGDYLNNLCQWRYHNSWFAACRGTFASRYITCYDGPARRFQFKTITVW